MFDGVLNKVEYCGTTESLSARPALLSMLCLISRMSQCLMIIWPSLLNGTSWFFLVSCSSASFIFFLSLCISIFYLCGPHRSWYHFSVRMQIINVCFSWCCKCKQALGSNLFTSAMWLLISDFLKISLCNFYTYFMFDKDLKMGHVMS